MRTSVVVGIDQTSYSNYSKLYGYLSVLDVCFSCLVIAPLVVAFWSSTWSSLKFLQFSHYPYFNVYVPISFGFSVLIIFTTFQKQIQVRKYLYFYTWFFRCYSLRDNSDDDKTKKRGIFHYR